jgi:hypothetical protein
MALVTRSSGQTIQATDIDQYHDLLTGIMTDQFVTLTTGLAVKSRGAAPGAASAAVAAGGSIDIGAHDYAVTFVGPGGGETLAGTHVTATTTTGNQTVNMSAIPTGPTGTSSRNIYRSKVGTTSPLFLLHSIADNTTTTYVDTATDASLPGTQPPTHPSFGGSTQWQDSTGAVKAQVYADGAFSFFGGFIACGVAGDVTLSNGSTDVNGLEFLDTVNNTWTQIDQNAEQLRIFSSYRGGGASVWFTLTSQTGLAAFAGNINQAGKNVPYINPTGASTAGRQIFTGSSTPSGANEGDIWIAA